jgi:hypothetical protein
VHEDSVRAEDFIKKLGHDLKQAGTFLTPLNKKAKMRIEAIFLLLLSGV